MKKRKILFWTAFFLLVIILLIVAHVRSEPRQYANNGGTVTQVSAAQTASQPADTADASLPSQVLLNDNYYVPQTFNNCGPAGLSMDLSYYGVNVSQEVLADALRPDHNTTGHDDDKSTPPDEIAAQAEQYGLIAYYRPAGSINLLKRLVAAGFPVMVRTLFMPTDEVAHYRVIKGYDDATTTPVIIDEDGFQGPNVSYSYADFMSLWKYYNYEYVVLATPAQQAQLESILGSDVDTNTAWEHAAQLAEQDLNQDPGDAIAQFDLSVADYYTGNYAQSVQEYENSQFLIPPDTLWYQMEPLESYYQLGEYSKIFSAAQQIFANNPAYPELYVLLGESYLKEGDPSEAKTEFQTALMYNKNLKSAQDALASL